MRRILEQDKERREKASFEELQLELVDKYRQHVELQAKIEKFKDNVNDKPKRQIST